MTDITIPAPSPVMTESRQVPAPLPVTTDPKAEQPKTTDVPPQPEKAAGETEPKTEGQKEELSQGEINRRERNKARWQSMKQALADSERKRADAEMSAARVRSRAAPDITQISDPTEALAERTAHKLREDQAGEYEASARRAAQESMSNLAEAWNATREEMLAKVPDFDKIVSAVPIHDRAVPHIVQSELGGEIALYLGRNPDAAQRLSNAFQKDPASAFIELGKIEARLSAPAPKTTSTAPRPASTLNGGVNPLAFDPHSSGVDDMAQHLKKAGLIR